MALLIGCAHQSGLAPLPAALSAPQAQGGASSFRVLYSFKGGRPDGDGAKPLSRLVELNGKLYGTTDSGSHDKLYGTTAAGGAKSKGVVYELTP